MNVDGCREGQAAWASGGSHEPGGDYPPVQCPQRGGRDGEEEEEGAQALSRLIAGMATEGQPAQHVHQDGSEQQPDQARLESVRRHRYAGPLAFRGHHGRLVSGIRKRLDDKPRLFSPDRPGCGRNSRNSPCDCSRYLTPSRQGPVIDLEAAKPKRLLAVDARLR